MEDLPRAHRSVGVGLIVAEIFSRLHESIRELRVEFRPLYSEIAAYEYRMLNVIVISRSLRPHFSARLLKSSGRSVNENEFTSAVEAVVSDIRVSVVFALLEIVQHFSPRPSFSASGGPLVVIITASSHVEHVVQNTASPEDFTSRPETLMILQTEARFRLRDGFIFPVEGRLL